MAISEKQKELDLIKWEKSKLLGKDACGSFNYCIHCNKEVENPCEKALNISNGVNTVVEDKPAQATCKTTSTEKTTTPKATACKTSKTACKTKKSTK